MVDLNVFFFFEKGGVLIFSGKAERSGSYRVETLGLNLLPHVLGHTVQIDNSG